MDFNDKARKLLDENAVRRLTDLHAAFAGLEEWSEDVLEASVKAYIEDADIKMGEVAQPLRAALTGTTASPGIFEVLAVLGREEVLGRIGDVLGAA